MYRIEIRRQAQRALDRLPKTDFPAVIEAIKNLSQTPRPRGMEKVKSTGLWRILSTALFGSYGTEQLALVIYAINIILVSIMRFVIWIYATVKYRLVDNNIRPSLLKWDRLISIGILFIFILMSGVSFINVAAARAVFILLGVLGLIISIIARKIFAIS